MPSFARSFVSGLLLFCLFMLVSPWLQAQSQMTTGTISGTVTDESGGVLPGVAITLRHVATNRTRELITDDAGRYTAPLLPVGDYEITAKLSGFATVNRSGVTLGLGQTLVVDLQMKPAAIEEVVTVTSAAPLIETEKSETGTLVEQRAVENLPLNGRRFLDLAFLTPGVTQEKERGQLTFSGSRGINSNINVDGADFNQPFFGGQRGGERTNEAYVVSQEAIREFQVVRGNSNAEFGRSTGGVVNVITKSGTDNWHGSGFYYLRHKELSPKDLFGDQRAPTRQQFGGSLGGPIIKDKTFFFTVYDQQAQRQALNIRFNEPGRSLLPPNLRAQEGTFRSTNGVNTYLVKIDHQLTKNNSLQGRYNYSRNEAENGTFTGTTSGVLVNNGLEKDRTHTAVINLSSIINPEMINEFRWQYSFEDRPRLNNGEGPNFVNRAGPQVQVTGCCFFGGVSFLPINQNDSRLQFSENFSYIKGKHSVKFGYDLNRSHVDQIFRGNWRGVYVFNNVNNYLANLTDPANNAADQFRVFFGDGKFVVSAFEHAAYLQDTIKVLPNVTLSLGLRYEAFVFPQPIQPNPLLAQTSHIRNDKNMWQPRFGLTWDPTKSGRTVFRIGGGLFHARTPLLLVNQAFTANGNPDVGVSFTLSPAQIRQARTAHPEFVFPFVPNTGSAASSSFFTGAGIAGLRPDATFFAENFHNPRALQYTASIERELTKNLSATLDYVHVSTVHLERIRNVNLFPPVLGVDPRDGQLRPIYDRTRLPNPNFGILRQQESSARANYDGFTLSLRRRQVGRLAFLTSYTLAYNRDDDSNERNFAGIAYEDAFDLRSEYRWSRNDIRHRWVLSGIYDLPLDFQISTILEYRSGTPFSAFTGVDSNNDGQFTDRPIIRGVRLLRNSFRQTNFFNQDVRLSRIFKFSERHKLSLIFEFFNFWNQEGRSYNVTTNESTTTAAGSVWGLGQTPLETFRNRNLRLSNGAFNRGGLNVATPFQLQAALKYTF
jgi:outer membrane receptor protein involved in Fe transport